MTELFTHHRTVSVFALSSLLALLLLTGGCSEQQSSDSAESIGTVKEGVMDAAPAVTTVELTESGAAPEAVPAEAESVAMAEDAGGTTAAADGEGVYNKACKVCHAAGIAGAPKLGDAAAWAPRIAKGEEALYGSIANGLNAMPPKGACMSCSEAELKSALQYMLERAG